MNFRKILFVILCLTFSKFSFAQDKIYKTNGTIIEAKVKSVGESTIVYLRFDNLKGPEYTILKSEVDKIKFENGTEESYQNNSASAADEPISYHRREKKNAMKGKYKPNVLAFAPIQFTENGIEGASLSYERVIDKDGIMAFYMPAILEFNTNSQQSGNSDPMFYLCPGFKIYPTGGYGLAKFAVGPQLVIADGSRTTASTDPNFNTIYTQQSHFIMGIMLNQSLNINPTPHFYLGAEFGFGYSYINDIGGVKQTPTGLVQFAFKVGIRY